MPRQTKVPEPTQKISARIEVRVYEAVAQYTGDTASKPSQAQAINEAMQWWVLSRGPHGDLFGKLAAIVESGDTKSIRKVTSAIKSAAKEG